MPDGSLPAPGGWNRFSLEVTDLEKVVKRLRGQGARFRNDIVTGVGGKQILLEDPSGNPIELFEPTLPDAAPRRRLTRSSQLANRCNGVTRVPGATASAKPSTRGCLGDIAPQCHASRQMPALACYCHDTQACGYFARAARGTGRPCRAEATRRVCSVCRFVELFDLVAAQCAHWAWPCGVADAAFDDELAVAVEVVVVASRCRGRWSGAVFRGPRGRWLRVRGTPWRRVG